MCDPNHPHEVAEWPTWESGRRLGHRAFLWLADPGAEPCGDGTWSWPGEGCLLAENPGSALKARLQFCLTMNLFLLEIQSREAGCWVWKANARKQSNNTSS